MKRLIDIMASVSLLVLLSPLLTLLAMLVWMRLGSPVLFRQTRPGKNAKSFRMLKFRTMTDERSSDGTLLPDGERLRPFGRWLRATSLDELPELWNVLRGDMSLVGPRPLAMAYLPLFSEDQSRRHEVLPGITGWAQVNGRNGISWKQKLEYDVWYVDNRSFWLDLRIILMTIGIVARRKNARAGGQDEVESFDGTN